MSVVNQTVSRSLAEAASAASHLIEKCIDHAVSELQQAEQQAKGDQRQRAADAWRELLVQRRPWSARLPTMLRTAFETEAVARARPASAPRDHEDMSLALVDDVEISRTIEAARLAQLLTSMLDRPLAELDALMSSALGLPGVQPERNPLRPSVYAQVLRDLMAEAKPDPAWPSMWLRHMTRPLADELGQIYKAQTHYLTLQRVSAANYRLRAGAEGPSSRAAALGPTSRSAPLGGPSRAAPLMPQAGPGAGMSRPAPLGGMSRPAPLGGMSRPAPLGGMSRPAPLGGLSQAPSGGGAQHASPGGPGWAAHPGGAAARAGSMAGAGSGPASAAAPLDPFSGGASGFADLTAREVDGARLQQFLLRGEPQAHRPLAPSYYAQVDAELRALEEQEEEAPYDDAAVRQQMHVPAVDRPARPVGTHSPLPQEIWGRFGVARERALVRGRLKVEAREVGQVFGLEVVRRLVDRVADDPRLLGPVREAMVGLEPSLLRLAMVAPRFFSDEEHPGRLLLERVAERSFRYNDEFSVEFQGFFGPVARSFQRLNEIDPLENADPFRAALTDLQATWTAQDALDEEPQRAVLGAVQFAERRQLEADRIGAEFAQRSDLEGVAGPVREFVLGPWALVVAHARLTQPGRGLDPGGYVAVVTDLLWSVKRELALHDPARAFELLPRLLMKLRTGLAMLGQQPADSQAFFLQLEALHRPVLKLRARQRHREFAPAEPPASLPPSAPAPAAEGPWMGAQELHAAGFEDASSDFGHLAASTRASHEHHALDEGEVEQVVSALFPGCWVDLFARQQWRRAHLKWASDKRTLFLFVSHGGQPHSMTRRSIQKLVKERLLRAVDAQAVVPRALEQLAQQGASAPVPVAA